MGESDAEGRTLKPKEILIKTVVVRDCLLTVQTARRKCNSRNHRQKRKDMFSKPITNEEERFIKENAQKMSISEIATSLGRSYFTVQKYMKILGIPTGFHKWTRKEDEILCELWENYPAGYISRVIGVDENCIYNRAKRLKLKKKRIVKPQG